MFKPSPTLQIKPDLTQVIYYGFEQITRPKNLRGCIAISSPSSTSIKLKSEIEVCFAGEGKTTHEPSQRERSAAYGKIPYIKSRHDRFSRTITLMDDTGAVLTDILPGEHEYRFEIALPGDLKESVEGVPEDRQYRKYAITAHAVMGMMTRDLRAKEKILIVRTVPTNADVELYSKPVVIQENWPKKLQYEIRTQSTGYSFGSQMQVNFRITPFAEELEVVRVDMWIDETELVRTDPCREDLLTGDPPFWRLEREKICKSSHDLPSGSDALNEQLQPSMKVFTLRYKMPLSLKQCRQSNERDHWMQFHHMMRYQIVLRNLEGHLSQLEAHHRIYLYIPAVPEDEPDRRTPDNLPNPTTVAPVAGSVFPPRYGAHERDQEVDPFRGIATGANTPGRSSGTATPGRILNPLQMTPTPEDLSDRLSILERTQTEPLGALEEAGSEERRENVPPRSFHMETLSRVPSYGTAVDSPRPGCASKAAPSYDDATGE